MFIIGLPGEVLDEESYRLLVDIGPAGVCLFSRNTKDGLKTRMLLDAVRDALLFEPFLCLDQEGGLVDRLRRIVEPMPSASDISRRGDPQKARDLAALTAEAIRLLGFNTNFAPVVDVITPEREGFVNGLHSRAFGNSAAEVYDLTEAYMAELQKGGVLGCLKHFPGLGAAQSDSHEELPSVGIGQEEFDAVDLEPYKRHFVNGNVHAVMVAHAAYPVLDLQETDGNGALLPSSLSPRVIDGLLRDSLGFNGLALTDDLEMGAIVKNYGIGEACVMAIGSGIDLLLICNSPEAVREGVEAVTTAVMDGRISEDRLNVSLERIAKVRTMLRPPLDFDPEALERVSVGVRKLKQDIR